MLLSCSCVMSATYAKMTEKVTAKTPDMEMTAKYHLEKEGKIRVRARSVSGCASSHFHSLAHHGLIFISGMGAHVKKTVSSRKDLRPQTSDKAPMRGALRNDSKPCGWGKKMEKQIDEA